MKSDKKNSIEYLEENKQETAKNYDAIITIIDGETESTFVDIWGEIISEGYPICSDLVIDNVGKNGYMSWDTIEALNNVGVEFIFHSCNHIMYNDRTIEDVRSNLERGVKEMDKHRIEHKVLLWLDKTREEVCKIGYDYFEGGIVSKSNCKSVYGEKNNPMMNEHLIGWYADKYCTLEELITFIETARINNGWAIIFTRNNSKMMDSTQIDIYRQVFEYAKQHNVAVVTASEGYDLYYGNKLGNN